MHDQRALELLTRRLLGNSYAQVEIGDWWRISFGWDLWLVFQDVRAPEECEVQGLLARSTAPLLDGVDSEEIAKAVCVLRNRRRPVTRVSLDETGALELRFDGDRRLVFPTSTGIVDWQWALNSSGRHPYADFLVACFQEGAVECRDAES